MGTGRTAMAAGLFESGATFWTFVPVLATHRPQVPKAACSSQPKPEFTCRLPIMHLKPGDYKLRLVEGNAGKAN